MIDIRPATPADRDAVVALLVAQMREHDIPTLAARLAVAFDHVLADAARGLILLACGGRAADRRGRAVVRLPDRGRRADRVARGALRPGDAGARLS